jgi:hypothetical protein
VEKLEKVREFCEKLRTRSDQKFENELEKLKAKNGL